MTRATRLAIALASSVFLLIPPSRASLHAAGQPAGDTHVQRYGEVTLRKLPRATTSKSTGRTVPFRPTNPERFQRLKSRAQIGSSPASVSSTAVLAASSIRVTDGGFDGMSYVEAGAIPPDSQIAVGPDHIFEVVNDRVRIWSRQTTSVVNDVDLGSFFGVGLFTTLTDIVSDPRIFFDQASGRWFVSCVTLETLLNTGDWRLAVSKTSDPTGTYTLYTKSFSGSFPDFPSLGMNDDKLVLTGNSYTISSQQFLGSEFLVANKSDLVAGVSNPADTFFGPPQAVDSIQGALSLSSTPTLFLAAVTGDGGTSALQVWSITGVPGVGSGVSVATQSLSMQTTLVLPPNAVQPNSTVAIATNDTRLLNLVYRGGSLWMGGVTGCTPAGDSVLRSCLHFAQVDATTRTVSQEVAFGEPGNYYYYPAVSIDANNNMLTVFNRSSSSEFASVYVSGQKATDGAGTFQPPTLVHSGLAVYDPSPNPARWGDYSGAAVDPFDGDASVWVAGEYMRAAGGSDWGTWLAKIATPSICAVPAPPSGLNATGGNAQVALAWATSTGATAYTVKRATVSGGPYTTVAGGVATRSYTDVTVTNGTTYYYVVSATDACGDESGPSNQASATPAVPPPPAAPTNLTATAGNALVSLTWSASSGATSYRVYRSTTSGSGYAQVASVTTTGYTDTGLTNGTAYYYVVTGVNAGGESAKSQQASATPLGPSLTISAPAVAPSSVETVTLANGLGGSSDWLALAAAGAPDSSYLQWTYVGTGVTTRTWTVTMPATAGTYEFRLFVNNARAATSPPVVVDPTISPSPTLSSLAPSGAPVGNTGFTLVATGSGFAAASVIRWNGTDRPTTFVSSAQLQAAIPATDLAVSGTAQVTVFSPAPGGGTSVALPFTIGGSPSLTLSASSVQAGAQATVTLTNGFGGSTDWLALASTGSPNTGYLLWTYVGAGVTSRTWAVTMPMTAGTYEFRLFLNNGYTRAATSPPMTVTPGPNPTPVLSSLSPSATVAGGAGFTLIATGSGFAAASVIRWNGTDRPTTFVSSAQLQAAIPATDLAVIRIAQVTVFTPAPGGGTSVALPFTISGSPSLTISASSVQAGALATVTLTNGFGGSADWLALASTGSPNTGYLLWTYVGAGVTSRTWTVTMPTTAGTYEFRLFLNNSYTIAATSPPITVTP